MQSDLLCPERLVIIFLRRFLVDLCLFLGRLRLQHVDRVLVHCIQVFLLRWHRDLDFVCVLGYLHNTEIGRNLVIALRSPGYVVHVRELHSERTLAEDTGLG